MTLCVLYPSRVRPDNASSSMKTNRSEVIPDCPKFEPYPPRAAFTACTVGAYYRSPEFGEQEEQHRVSRHKK
jgi:hypothetical protein